MNEVHGWLTTDGKFFPIDQADEASKHQYKLDLEAAAPELLKALTFEVNILRGIRNKEGWTQSEADSHSRMTKAIKKATS